MELGPELCLWMEFRNRQTDSHAISSNLSQYDSLPTHQENQLSFTGLPGLVLELESDSDIDYCNDNSEETGVIFVPDPHDSSNSVTRIPQLQRRLEIACHDETPSDISACLNKSPAENRSGAIADPFISNSHILNKQTTACTNIRSEEDEGQSGGCNRPLVVGDSISVGQNDTQSSETVPEPPSVIATTVLCPQCSRQFVNRRSMLIHSTKTHRSNRISKVTEHLPSNDGAPSSVCIDSGTKGEEEVEDNTPAAQSAEKYSVSNEPVQNLSTASSPSAPSFSSSSPPTKRVAYAVSQRPPSESSLKLRLVSVSSPDCFNAPGLERLTVNCSGEPHHISFASGKSRPDKRIQTEVRQKSSIAEFPGACESAHDEPSPLSSGGQPLSSCLKNSMVSVDFPCSVSVPGTTVDHESLSRMHTREQSTNGPFEPCFISESHQLDQPQMDTGLRTQDGLFKCRICRRLFQSRYALTGHYKSHYLPGQKPYRCDDCGQRYTSPSNLHYHRSRNCPVLRLRAINENTAAPTSVRSMKRIENKARRASEHMEFIRRIELKAVDGPHREIQRRQPSRLLRSTQTPSVKQLPSAGPTEKNVHNDRPNREAVPPKNLCDLSRTIRQNQSYIGRSMEDTRSSRNLTRRKTDRTSFSPTSPSARSSAPVNMKKICSGTPDTRPNSFPNKNYENVQAHLRNILEEACKSESAREKILSFTTAALLSALNPMTEIHDNLTGASLLSELKQHVHTGQRDAFDGLSQHTTHLSDERSGSMHSQRPRTNERSYAISDPPKSECPPTGHFVCSMCNHAFSSYAAFYLHWVEKYRTMEAAVPVVTRSTNHTTGNSGSLRK